MTKSPKGRNAAQNPERLENILAFMTAGVIGVSVLTIIVVLISYFAGYHQLPALLALIPLIGLPIGMLLLVSLVLVSARRKKREAN